MSVQSKCGTVSVCQQFLTSVVLTHLCLCCFHYTRSRVQVQTSNAGALSFYQRQGFEQTGKLENYYKKLEPPHCYVLTKKFVHLNFGGSATAKLD
jgi:hypothetical protein